MKDQLYDIWEVVFGNRQPDTDDGAWMLSEIHAALCEKKTHQVNHVFAPAPPLCDNCTHTQNEHFEGECMHDAGIGNQCPCREYTPAA
jgi:hypothetical protein